MRRVLLDTSVLVSGAIISLGPSARLVDAVRSGRLELVVCPTLIAELTRTLALPRLARRVAPELAGPYIALIDNLAVHYPDPTDIDPAACRDPNDAYLLALATTAAVDALVTGDKDLLVLTDHQPPVISPAAAVELLADG